MATPLFASAQIQQCKTLLEQTGVQPDETRAEPDQIQGDSKNMSPLAFKSNNSRPMSRTTLPDTAFERADNFLSNECIHTRFPFQ